MRGGDDYQLIYAHPADHLRANLLIASAQYEALRPDGRDVDHDPGLSVKQLTALRREMLKAGGEVQVAKNRLAKLAFKGTAFEAVTDLMVGPTLLVYGLDGITATKLAQVTTIKTWRSDGASD